MKNVVIAGFTNGNENVSGSIRVSASRMETRGGASTNANENASANVRCLPSPEHKKLLPRIKNW